MHLGHVRILGSAWPANFPKARLAASPRMLADLTFFCCHPTDPPPNHPPTTIKRSKVAISLREMSSTSRSSTVHDLRKCWFPAQAFRSSRRSEMAALLARSSLPLDDLPPRGPLPPGAFSPQSSWRSFSSASRSKRNSKSLFSRLRAKPPSPRMLADMTCFFCCSSMIFSSMLFFVIIR